jgi:CubicO group peptidase (beta-lactamase class C family)
MRSLLALPLALAASSPISAQPLAARLEAIVRAALTEGGPGCAVLVARGDEILLREAYGRADADGDVPLRVEQPFYVASIAKSFTAACILHLARAGKIGLDDDVTKHVPELPEHARGITLRHLLHHRGGLRDFYELEWLASRNPVQLTTRGVLDLLRRQRGTNFAPDADFLYCNSGYLLLAEVVARKSGRSLHDYAQEHVFAPLGMSSTTYRDDAHREVKDVPRAYDDDKPSLEPPLLCGAGGLFTTVDDLHRWLTALAGSAWEPELVHELVTPPALRAKQRRSPQLNPYAGGLFVGALGGETELLMLGGFGGWQAAALALPGAGVHAILLANTDLDAIGTVHALARAVIGLDEAPRAANDAKPGFAAYRAADGELLFHATRRSGPSFLTTLGWKIEVAEHDGVLRSHDARTPVTAQRGDDGALEVRIEGEDARRYAKVAMAGASAADVAALAGTWHAPELDADLVLQADGARLALDASRMMLPVAPFQAVDRDTWISDTGMQIDVHRGTDGKPESLRISTARARGVLLEHK